MGVRRGEVDHGFTRSAFWPVTCSQRATITSQYERVDLHQERAPLRASQRDQRRARSAEQVEHVLAGLATSTAMARAASSTGFSVRWTIDCGLTFLTAQRSGTLVGPEEAGAPRPPASRRSTTRGRP